MVFTILTVFCEENLKKFLLASMRSIVKILLATLLRACSDFPIAACYYKIKNVPKAACDPKIGPKAGHECSLAKIDQGERRTAGAKISCGFSHNFLN